MNGAQRSANLIYFYHFLVILGIVFLSTGCEDPGSVGNNAGDNDSVIRVSDTTFIISDVTVDSVNAFSGNKEFFSAGMFNDPLFGNIKSVSLLRPSLPPFTSSLEPTVVMKLRLGFNKQMVYGDTLSRADFELIKIGELWRQKAWKYDNEAVLDTNSEVIASFSITNQDSMEITMGEEWVDEYKSFFNDRSPERDSLYRFNFFGLAIVPKNEAKIIPFRRTSAEFVLEERFDTTIVPVLESAMSLERTNVPEPPEETEITHSTLERVIGFTMDLTGNELGTFNISRAELVIPLDLERMDETLGQFSGTAIRPPNNNARLFLARPGLISDVLDVGNPISTGSFSETDSAFHFDLTNFVNSVLEEGLDPDRKFFFALGSNSGLLRSALLFNSDAPLIKQPKLNVTFIKTE